MAEITYELPLGEPPAIRAMGIGRHGNIPYERFFVPGLWCMHFFLDPLDLKVDGNSFVVHGGNVTLMPPSVPIEYFFPRPVRHTHYFVMFEVPPKAETASIGALHGLGNEFTRWLRALEEALAWHQTQPRRAEARLWEILWHLAGSSQKASDTDPLIEKALELIERGLHEPLTVAGLAEQLEVSHNHLTRRFRAATGLTVVETIRRRRVDRAENLLRYTTLPIKAIAAQSGLGDFHSFNKALRRELGHGPRVVRKATSG